MPTTQRALAAEIGGTFTDVILLEQSDRGTSVRVLKVPSTPSAPENGVLAAIDRLQVDLGSTDAVLHGSTVATNAVLERKGVTTALITTEGFRDLLEIQRGDKENIYDLVYRRPAPLVPREWVYPVYERVSRDGSILIDLDAAQVEQVAHAIRQQGIQAVAICLLHSYANPAHEERVREIIQQVLPDALVLASSDILPQFREYERASTTVMSAYIAPIMVRYIESLKARLEERGFGGRILLTQSNGGIIPPSAIRQEVVRTLLSGPAAGVTGALFVARDVGLADIITLDMGGTSTDVCLVNSGHPSVTTENKVGGLPVAIPMLDITTVGAGGGSIAWLDEAGMLRVGPQSAGAHPGPACFGRGGQQPTVTDAQVYRGLVRSHRFAGGTFPLDVAACTATMERWAAQLGMSPDGAADAITRIVEANMIQAIRVVSTQRGHDPRAYTLVPFGGAGPLHACKLAEELGMAQVLVPSYAGILSAFGLLVADVVRDYVQTRASLAAETAPADVEATLDRLAERAYAELETYGFRRDQIECQPACDARYQGQAFELTLPLEWPLPSPAEIAERFHAAHRARYGHSSPGEPVEFVNYRLRAVVRRSEAVGQEFFFHAPDQARVEHDFADVTIDGRREPCRFYDRATLPLGFCVAGPAVVEEETSTCLIPAGWQAEVLRNGSLLITREE